jgi:hypothetical protein
MMMTWDWEARGDLGFSETALNRRHNRVDFSVVLFIFFNDIYGNALISNYLPVAKAWLIFSSVVCASNIDSRTIS